MSAKTERPQVRTAQDLERKYASLLNSGTAIKQTETGLTKVNNILNEFISAAIGDLETLQAQLDGQIDTWYGYEPPTLLNPPVSNWQESEYADHVDDLYYDNSTGNTYKFTENDGEYSWEEVASSLMSEILSLANAANDTADNKRRVFVVQPTPPYDVGDLWLNNKELYVCQIAKDNDGTYQDSDFIIATKYIDSSAVLTNDQVVEIITEQTGEWVAATDSLTGYFTTEKKAQLDATQEYVLEKVVKQVQIDGDITLSADNSVYSLRITNNGIEIRNTSQVNPISSWIEDGMDIRKLYLGNFAFIPRENGSLGFRKVK